MPQTPMFFMGQEFAATNPFHYFADHNQELSGLIRQGRAKELSQFPSIATPEPCSGSWSTRATVRTFEMCKLNWAERADGYHAEAYRLHGDLLRLRREEPCFAARAEPGRGRRGRAGPRRVRPAVLQPVPCRTGPGTVYSSSTSAPTWS